jgi:transglutaminase-like putative cysteine protease
LATQQPSRSTLVAVGVLSAGASLCLARVFRGWGWLVPCLVAALASVALGALCDRVLRRTPLTIAALAIGAAILGLEVSEPGSTASGLPTPTALAAYRHDLAQMGHVLHTASVPVHPIGTALLLAVVASWLTGSAAYLCATRFAGSLAALVAPLTIFVTVSALGRGSQAPTTLAFGVGVACFLLAQQRAALTDRRARFHASSSRIALPIAGAAVATAVALAAGLVAGPTLPGARSNPLIDYRRLGGSARGSGNLVVVTPLVDIRDRLTESPAQELFTVETDHPTYWRIAGLDEFDGNVWNIAETQSSPADALESAPRSRGHALDINATFDTSSLAGPWVPVAYQPRSIDLHAARVLPGSDTVIVRTTGAINATYKVTSEEPEPTATELASAHVANDSAAQADLQLPRNFPSEVQQLALHLTADAHGNAYQMALALQNYLRGPDFTYSLSVPKSHSGSELDDFLFNTHAGFCEQFASAFAAMARSIGLPTRVAVGFTPGEADPTGKLHVTTQDAHAWPEVDFAGIGWIRFEPTKGRFDPTPSNYNGTLNTSPTTAPSSTVAPATTAPNTATGPSDTRNPALNIERNLNGGGGGSSGSGSSAGAAALRFLLAVVALLLGLALVSGGGIVGAKSLRRMRRRRAPTARARIAGAWDEVVERLAEARIHRRPSTTPVEFAMREAPASGAGSAGPPLLALAHLTTSALYSPVEPSDEEAEEAWQHVRELERQLRAPTAFRVRVRRRLDPRVLRGSLPGDVELADDDIVDDALVVVTI